MSQDKRNIDELFRAKLRDYEATPPSSAWDNIVIELKVLRRTGKMILLKRAGAAAAVVAAILAGWWLIHPGDVSEKHEIATNVTASPKTEVTNPINPAPLHSETTQLSLPGSTVQTNSSAGFTNNRSREFRPSLNTMASFAPGTALLNKSSEPPVEVARETVLFDVEKEFLSNFRNDLKLIKEFSDRIGSFNSNKMKDTIRQRGEAIQVFNSSKAGNISFFNSDTKKERLNDRSRDWTLSAGISPLTITQRRGGSSVTGQSTSYENTVSGSMLAGYKIGKKIVVKSGVILNQLRQVTRITDYPPAYSREAHTFKTANVATTSGSVNLDKAVLIKADVLFSSEVLPTPGMQPELKQEFRYVEIPVEMVYKLIDQKFNLGVTAGVSTNILAGNRAGLYENGQRINRGRTSNLRDINYSGAIGIELGYDLNSRVTLTVEPHIKRFLNSLSSNEEIDFKPYQFDIMTGVTYSFN